MPSEKQLARNARHLSTIGQPDGGTAENYLMLWCEAGKWTTPGEMPYIVADFDGSNPLHFFCDLTKKLD